MDIAREENLIVARGVPLAFHGSVRCEWEDEEGTLYGDGEVEVADKEALHRAGNLEGELDYQGEAEVEGKPMRVEAKIRLDGGYQVDESGDRGVMVLKLKFVSVGAIHFVADGA